jgi:transposase-like protein
VHLVGRRPRELARSRAGVSQATLYLWKRRALIDAGRAEGVKSFEADELAQAHRTIAVLEAELEIVRAATALFNGEESVNPKGGARLPRR